MLASKASRKVVRSRGLNTNLQSRLRIAGPRLHTFLASRCLSTKYRLQDAAFPSGEAEVNFHGPKKRSAASTEGHSLFVQSTIPSTTSELTPNNEASRDASTSPQPQQDGDALRNVPRQYHGPKEKGELSTQDPIRPLAVAVDENDELGAIYDLETARRELDWRERLKDEEDFEHESGLDKPSIDGRPRLIESHITDLELWELLFLYRVRVHGPESAKMIWRHFDDATHLNPMRVWERPRLWESLLQVLLAAPDTTKELIAHCNKMAFKLKDQPDRFYIDVMKHCLSVDPANASQWHKDLIPFLPDKREVKTLFKSIADQPSCLRAFTTICFQIPSFTGMYRYVIPELCSKKMFKEAIEWHDLLLKQNDYPESFDSAEWLLRRLSKEGNAFLVHKIASDLNSVGVPGGRRWLRDPALAQSQAEQEQGFNSPETKEGQVSREFNFHDLPAKQLSDAFVARLVATTFFSVETILNGLSAINTIQLGPVAFRQLLLRLCGAEEDVEISVSLHDVRRAETILDRAGIELAPCTYSLLLIKLAADEQSLIMQSLVHSHEHPDTFDDADYQESLLARNIALGQAVDAQRTLAVLREIGGEIYKSPQHSEVTALQLLHAIEQKDKTTALMIIEGALARRESLNPYILTGVFFKLLFTPRHKSLRPRHYRELNSVTSLMQRLHQLGYPVPMRVWAELMKRRAWQANLSAMRQLLLWNFRWIKDENFRLAETLPEARSYDWTSYYRAWNMKMTHSKTYSEVFFGGSLVRHMIAMGFEADCHARMWDINTGKARALQGSYEEKVKILMEDDCTWGLRFLVQLRDMGQPFTRDEVRKACAAQLIILFGPLLSQKQIERRIKMGRQANWIDYARAMENIWGEPLFIPHMASVTNQSEDEESIRTRLTAYQNQSLGRAALRSRLKGYWDDVDEHSNGVPGARPWKFVPEHERPANSRARQTRAYMRRLVPPASTDEYLKQLIPELNMSGRLEHDPLHELTRKEIQNLTHGNFKVDFNPEESYHSNGKSGIQFTPYVAEEGEDLRTSNLVTRWRNMRRQKDTARQVDQGHQRESVSRE